VRIAHCAHTALQERKALLQLFRLLAEFRK
jgi:hypothetical protein